MNLIIFDKKRSSYLIYIWFSIEEFVWRKIYGICVSIKRREIFEGDYFMHCDFYELEIRRRKL